MDKQLTDEEKQKECDRVCKPYYDEESIKKGWHSLDCPFKHEIWKNPKRKKEY